MGKSLKGSVLYSDGQFDDARLNVALAVTAAHAGAVVLNHCSVVDLLKDNDVNREKVTGAILKDEETGEDTYCGASESHRQLRRTFRGRCASFRRSVESDQGKKWSRLRWGRTLCCQNITFQEKFGMIIPKTKDGRVVFLLPWLDHAVAGTTDIALKPGEKTPKEPLATQDEVDYILETIAPYLALQPHRQEILSVWWRARPLAKDPTKTNSSDLSRDHVIAKETPSDVIVVAGGKWTTYRLMAEETVDLVLKTMREWGKRKRDCELSRRATWALLAHMDTKILFRHPWRNLEATDLVVQIQIRMFRDIWQLRTAIARWLSHP